MNMKEICKAFTEKLDGIITDSFYDDEGDGFIELTVDNPDTSDKNIQIEIDSTYYGFSYCCYDEIHDYDGHEKETIEEMCSKIFSIVEKTSCLIKIETSDDVFYKLADLTSIDNNTLADLITESTEAVMDGTVKIILWNAEIIKEFSFDGEEYVFF